MILLYQDLNQIKKLIENVTIINQTSFDENEWAIDFSLDLNEELVMYFERFDNLISFIYKAIELKDWITAHSFLIHLNIYAQNIAGFFDNIAHDFNKLIEIDVEILNVHALTAIELISKNRFKKKINIDLNRLKLVINDISKFNEQISYTDRCQLVYFIDFNRFINEMLKKLEVSFGYLLNSLLAQDLIMIDSFLENIVSLSTKLSVFFYDAEYDIKNLSYSFDSKLPEIPEDNEKHNHFMRDNLIGIDFNPLNDKGCLMIKDLEILEKKIFSEYQGDSNTFMSDLNDQKIFNKQKFLDLLECCEKLINLYKIEKSENYISISKIIIFIMQWVLSKIIYHLDLNDLSKIRNFRSLLLEESKGESHFLNYAIDRIRFISVEIIIY